MKQVVVILVLILALAAAVHWDGPNRSLTVTKTDHQIAVRAVKNGGSLPRNAVSFLFTTNWIPRFVFRYFHANADSVDAFAARWLLMKVFEYQEVDGTAGFNPATDSIVTENEHRLWLLNNWSTINATKTELTDGTVMWSACTATPASASQIGAEICMEAASGTVNTTNGGIRRKLSPSAIKWSLRFSGLSLTNTSNRWALKMRFDGADYAANFSNTDGVLESGEDATALYTSTTTRVLSTWVKTVDLSGCAGISTADLIKSVWIKNDSRFDEDSLPSGDDDGLSLLRTVNYFSVNWQGNTCNPSQIYWDPELGVTGDDSVSSATSQVIGSILIVVLLSMLLL